MQSYLLILAVFSMLPLLPVVSLWSALVLTSGLNGAGSRGHLELGLWPWALEATKH